MLDYVANHLMTVVGCVDVILVIIIALSVWVERH